MILHNLCGSSDEWITDLMAGPKRVLLKQLNVCQKEPQKIHSYPSSHQHFGKFLLEELEVVVMQC